MEDGEVYEPTTVSTIDSVSGELYHPSYEWPGEFPVDATSAFSLNNTHNLVKTTKRNQPSLRLLVLRSSILPSKHKLVIFDGYSELQFGRDIPPSGSNTPRIRLKEMEVSKLHATAYWDVGRREWNIVDMGSKHGTFLQPAATSIDDVGRRLSRSREASIPRRLHHLDCLTVGSTTFLIHLHESQVPCEECSPLGGDEIPLFPMQKGGARAAAEHAKGQASQYSVIEAPTYAGTSTKDHKRALTNLKRSLLTRVESRSAPFDDDVVKYTDRSARRRALYPASGPDAPGVSTPSTWSEVSSAAVAPPEPTTMISEAPKALTSSNVGHRLLMKQGWTPGTALGLKEGLVEPLEVSSNADRTGLGAKPKADSRNWKEKMQERRWRCRD